MSHIFISYSRKDRDLVTRIVRALEEKGLDIWIDQDDIPKGEDWEQKIYQGIESADAFVFITSPNSVESEICRREVTHALKNNKRILPIIIRDVDVKPLLPEISKLNWIFCRDGQDDFERAIEDTYITIHTNYEWVEFHTKLQNKALDWERRKDNSRLLRGAELKEAERRLKEDRSPKDSMPTDLMRGYMLQSKNFDNKQRRLPSRIIMGVVLFIIISIALFYVWDTSQLYGAMPISPACPAVGQVSVVTSLLDYEREDAFDSKIVKEVRTNLRYCRHYSIDNLEVTVSNQNNGNILLKLILPSTPAYKLDFLHEIREFGPESVSVEEAIKLINASSAYSVGNYQKVVTTLGNDDNLSAATLNAQAYLHLDKLEQSRWAYTDAMNMAKSNGNSVDQLRMGAALAWWRPVLYHVSSEPVLECEKSKEQYSQVGMWLGDDAWVNNVKIVYALYCNDQNWINLIEREDDTNPETTAIAYLTKAIRCTPDNVEENCDYLNDLLLAEKEVSIARDLLIRHFVLRLDKENGCNRVVPYLEAYRMDVFNGTDINELGTLLRLREEYCP